SSQANQISVVGSTSPSGSLALASTTAGLPPGLIVIPVPITPGSRAEPAATPPDPDIPGEGVPSTRRVSALEAGLLARSSESRRADDRSLAEADWIGRLVSAAVGWLGQSGDGKAAIVDPSAASALASDVGEIP